MGIIQKAQEPALIQCCRKIIKDHAYNDYSPSLSVGTMVQYKPSRYEGITGGWVVSVKDGHICPREIGCLFGL